MLPLYERLARASGDERMLLDCLERRAASRDATIDYAREGYDLAVALHEDARAEALLERVVAIGRAQPGAAAEATWGLLELAKRRRAVGDLAGAHRALAEALEIGDAAAVLGAAARSGRRRPGRRRTGGRARTRSRSPRGSTRRCAPAPPTMRRSGAGCSTSTCARTIASRSAGWSRRRSSSSPIRGRATRCACASPPSCSTATPTIAPRSTCCATCCSTSPSTRRPPPAWPISTSATTRTRCWPRSSIAAATCWPSGATATASARPCSSWSRVRRRRAPRRGAGGAALGARTPAR